MTSKGDVVDDWIEQDPYPAKQIRRRNRKKKRKHEANKKQV